jgi:hypothetical protein
LLGPPPPLPSSLSPSPCAPVTEAALEDWTAEP